MAAVTESIESESPKKPGKTEENPKNSVHGTLKDLSDFKLTDVLQNNTKAKTVFLRGSFHSQEGEALVILEKTAFCADNLTQESEYFTDKSALEQVFQNDVYGDYKYFPVQELNTVKTTIIHPASEKHIARYSIQNLYMINETPEIYHKFTLPSLNEDKFDLQWVYNILEHKSESDRILVEDPDPINGFVVVPDLKWGGEIDTLYFLALCNQWGIKSIRDLTGQHLPLLRNIRDKTVAAITSKYGLDASQLRIYFHYQPSFYHLHIHFTYLRHEAPGIVAERAHILTTVINNLELLPDYYQRATLPYVIRENDKLFVKLEKEGLVTKKNVV